MRCRHRALATATAVAVLAGCYDATFRPVIVIVGDAGTGDSGTVPGCLTEAHALILLEPGCATFRVEAGPAVHACMNPGLPETGVPVRLVLGGGAGTVGEATVTFDCPTGSDCGCVLTLAEDVCGPCTVGCGLGRWAVDVVDGQTEILVTNPASIELCSRPD